MNTPRFNVLIIGGGFSGTILAAQLLYRAPALKIGILDKGALPGRGVAYGTGYKYHLLNLPAEKMSAFPEQPEHFVGWARANYEPTIQPRSFLPRGRFMGDTLNRSYGMRRRVLPRETSRGSRRKRCL